MKTYENTCHSADCLLVNTWDTDSSPYHSDTAQPQQESARWCGATRVMLSARHFIFQGVERKTIVRIRICDWKKYHSMWLCVSELIAPVTCSKCFEIHFAAYGCLWSFLDNHIQSDNRKDNVCPNNGILTCCPFRYQSASGKNRGESPCIRFWSIKSVQRSPTEFVRIFMYICPCKDAGFNALHAAARWAEILSTFGWRGFNDGIWNYMNYLHHPTFMNRFLKNKRIQKKRIYIFI